VAQILVVAIHVAGPSLDDVCDDTEPETIDFPPEHLRDIASYAEKLAEHKVREDRLEEGSNEGESEVRPDDLPGDVPSRATITNKEINDNRYYYWQWREGDKSVRSTRAQSTRRSSRPLL
jgi:hypothetical protein